MHPAPEISIIITAGSGTTPSTLPGSAPASGIHQNQPSSRRAANT